MARRLGRAQSTFSTGSPRSAWVRLGPKLLPTLAGKINAIPDLLEIFHESLNFQVRNARNPKIQTFFRENLGQISESFSAENSAFDPLFQFRELICLSKPENRRFFKEIVS